MIELAAGDVVVEVDAVNGGRVAQITVGERQLLVADTGDGAISWGMFPMVPWAGRIRDGRFSFAGVDHQLERNLGPNAIHGTGFVQPWTAVDQGEDFVDLQCRLTWALGGIAQQHLQLSAGELVCFLTVVAQGQALPATIGWHPWFVTPDRLDAEFAAMYERGPDHLPTGRMVPPRAHPWDDCFVQPAHDPHLTFADLHVTIASDCDHWVVFDELERGTCVEPQSGPPDAFNIGGATVLQPGEMLQRVLRIRWAGSA